MPRAGLGLSVLCVFLVAMPVDAQPPCASLPVRVPTTPPRPASSVPEPARAPQDPLPLDLSQVCLELDTISQRLARIEAQQKLEADRKPVLVAVLGNRYVELVLVAASAFFTGWKLR
jgi:hypothetical protein